MLVIWDKAIMCVLYIKSKVFLSNSAMVYWHCYKHDILSVTVRKEVQQKFVQLSLQDNTKADEIQNLQNIAGRVSMSIYGQGFD